MALEKGWNVYVVTKDTGKRKEVEKLGAHYIELPINPTGKNLKDELRLFNFLRNLLKRHPHAIIHLVGLKNILWGGLANRFAKSKGTLFAVSGLGSMFGENNNKLLNKVLQSFLRFGMNHKNSAVIFQNKEDMDLFVSNNICNKSKIFFIKGSGVDLNLYKTNLTKNNERLQIVFTARMLREKGVEELIKAAELLRAQYQGKIQFILCGDISSNPNALTEKELTELTDGDYIIWLGHCDNIPEILAQSDIMCFPSYYREGVPKSLLEASAAGLPIVTTDSIGCKDTVDHGKNGLLVPVHSPEAIAKSLDLLINNPELRKKMSQLSRKKAEQEYDVEIVAEKHLEIYVGLLNN